MNKERYYIAMLGKNGCFGVWNVMQERWTVMPNHTESQAAVMADQINALNQEANRRQKLRERRVPTIRAFAQIVSSIPIAVSRRLCSDYAERRLFNEYRN